MDKQPGKPSNLCSFGTGRILIRLKIRAFRYSIHTEPQKSDAQPFKFVCKQSENIERSRTNEVSGLNFQPVENLP